MQLPTALFKPARLEKPTWLFALAEQALEEVLRGRLERVYVVEEWVWKPTPVYALYTPAQGCSGYRRLTGGLPLLTKRGDTYLFAAERGCRSLRDALESLDELLHRLGLRRDGLIVRGARLVFGATRIEDVCVVELLGGLDQRLLLDSINADDTRVVEVDVRLAEGFASRAWRCYEGARGGVFIPGSATGAWARVHVLHDGKFVTKVKIDGCFLAAPPMEIYSLAAILEGVPLDTAIYTLDVGLESRVELYGVNHRDLLNAVQRYLEQR